MPEVTTIFPGTILRELATQCSIQCVYDPVLFQKPTDQKIYIGFTNTDSLIGSEFRFFRTEQSFPTDDPDFEEAIMDAWMNDKLSFEEIEEEEWQE